MAEQPPYPPAPLPDPNNGGHFLKRFLRARRSWLDLVNSKSYSMKMGEVRGPLTTLYIPNEPPLVRRVMQDERTSFPKDRRYWSLIEPMVGLSILNSDGAEWERQRRMIDPAFEGARMKLLFPMMRECADAMATRIDGLAGGVFEVDPETTHVTADIILRALISLPLVDEDARLLHHHFKIFCASLPVQTSLALGRLPAWLGVFFGARRGRRSALAMRGLLETRIRPRWEAFRAGNPGPQQDILAGLLVARDEPTGHVFAFSELVDHVAMLFLAGHETSASALAWAIYLVASHPEIQERMAAEVATEIGDRPIEFADLKRLRFILDVFRETLRLYPPVGFLPRMAACPVTMRDKAIKAGCPVMIAPWLLGRHRKHWQHADHFDPDRFRRGEENEAIASMYLPFGSGPRVCIGMALALQEATLILATLVRRFRFAAIPGDAPLPVGRLTVRSERGIRVTVTRR
jgi:cytochrome P450